MGGCLAHFEHMRECHRGRQHNYLPILDIVIELLFNMCRIALLLVAAIFNYSKQTQTTTVSSIYPFQTAGPGAVYF